MPRWPPSPTTLRPFWDRTRSPSPIIPIAAEPPTGSSPRWRRGAVDQFVDVDAMIGDIFELSKKPPTVFPKLSDKGEEDLKKHLIEEKLPDGLTANQFLDTLTNIINNETSLARQVLLNMMLVSSMHSRMITTTISRGYVAAYPLCSARRRIIPLRLQWRPNLQGRGGEEVLRPTDE